MTLTAEQLEEVKDLLYTQNYYFNNRFGNPEYEATMKQANLRLLEIMTNGAYPVKPQGADKNPANTEPPTPEIPATSPKDKGISVGTLKIPKWEFPDGGAFPAVIARFTPEEFRAYVQWSKKNERYSWSPGGITMHHTAVPNPSYDKWRDGWSEQLLKNCRSGYISNNGWNAGPHVFTDHNGIWVLNPLCKRGVHASSFNADRFGIEMLLNGDDKAQVESSVGQANIKMGQIAAAILMKDWGISTAKLNFHRHDPKTTKTCPGKHIDFQAYERGVIEIYQSLT